MSFLSGIEQDVTNFFSGVSDVFSGVVNFGSNIVNGVQNAVQGVVNAIANIGQGMYNGLMSIGNDIANVFGQLGGAIWHGLVSFATSLGSFLYQAYHIVASAIYGAFQRIANAFEFVGKWIWSGIVHIGDALHGVGEWLYNGLREIGSALAQLPAILSDIYADIKAFFSIIWNGLVAVADDIFNTLVSFVQGVEHLFNDAVDYVTNIFNDLLYVPEDVSKYVATKVTSVLPRLIAYNLFFEEMKSLDRLAENMAISAGTKKAFLPILLKIGSPFIAGLTSMVVESAISSFFPELAGNDPPSRKKLTPPPKSDIAKNISIPHPFHSTMSAYVPPIITQPSRAVVQLKSAKTFEKYVVGVKETDEELLTTIPVISNKIASPYPNFSTTVDQLNINGYIIQIPKEFILFSETDKVYVLPYGKLILTEINENDSIDVSFSGGISVKTYLPGIPLCPSPTNNVPTGNINGAINDGIESNVQICLEIGNVMNDTVNASISLYSSSSAPT